MRQEDDKITAFYQKKHLPSILGGESFKQRIVKLVAKVDREIVNKPSQQHVSMDTIIQRVAEHYQITVAMLLERKLGQGQTNWPRCIAINLCHLKSGETLTSIARKFNVGHYSTISKTVQRFNQAKRNNEELSRIFNVLCQD